MSSVFSKPKVNVVQPEEVTPQVVDLSEETRALEQKRKKKMGAISQLLSHDDSYSGLVNGQSGIFKLNKSE